jgi:hypothetical protein
MAITLMYPTKRLIHVYLDNARYHHAVLVREWLARPGCTVSTLWGCTPPAVVTAAGRTLRVGLGRWVQAEDRSARDFAMKTASQ